MAFGMGSARTIADSEAIGEHRTISRAARADLMPIIRNWTASEALPF